VSGIHDKKDIRDYRSTSDEFRFRYKHQSSERMVAMIENYSMGQMTVGGKTHRRDLKIVGGEVKGEWWRKQGHRLSLEDIRDIFDAAPEKLIVGTGYASNMRVPDSVRKALENKNIEVTVDNTYDAVKKFNALFSEGRSVAGAFHLTC
jgi:hypothetical protein